jgi:hypothetical protein
MNKNEYLAELKGLNQALQIVTSQIVEANKNAIETGSDETLRIRKEEHHAKLLMIYSKFNNINPPSGFEKAHQLYLESINYSMKGEISMASNTHMMAHNETMNAAGLR